MEISLKKFINILLYSFILFIVMPLKVSASNTEYIDVNIQNSVNLTEKGVTFTKMTFNNFYDNGMQIGMSGIVSNSNSYAVSYQTITYLFDASYNTLGQIEYKGVIPAETQYSYSDLRFVDSLGNIDPNNIAYYVFAIDVTGENNSQSSDYTPSNNPSYNSKDYVIDAYNIDIILNENNTLDITETITAYFNIPKHGIYRTIPLKNEVTRLDGKTTKNRAQVTNLNVDNEYKVSRKDGYYKIQIGSAYETLTGRQTYIIKYTYNLGKDPIKDYDELYYNIIGNEWDTVIGNITFSISMPKGFDESKLGFSSGVKGSTDSSKVNYKVEGNKITGSYNGILNSNEALTVRCELEEGYFVGARLSINPLQYIIFILPVVFMLISIFIWYKFGRDKKPVVTVEFYPPEGFNSLELGFLYKGFASDEDVTSLLIYLANKGYIKISETDEKSLFTTSKGFKITKLKDYDGNNINEHLFLKGLFTKSGDEVVNEVRSLDLYNNFYKTNDKILANINNKENRNKIFGKTASKQKKIIILMIIAIYCLITIPPVIIYGELSTLLFALIFPGIGFVVTFSMLTSNDTMYINGKATNSKLAINIFALVWGLMFGGIPWIFMVLLPLLQDFIYLFGYLVGLICCAVMIICFKHLPKRTSYGTEILGKILGFKNFLETAEKDRLETMVNENPTYFYDILPYTYVLGISDTWIKKFETISIQAPTWYDSSSFDMASFSIFVGNTMMSANNVLSSSPSSSSGGSSSSSGGSSGGGSGGGGGGSW